MQPAVPIGKAESEQIQNLSECNAESDMRHGGDGCGVKTRHCIVIRCNKAYYVGISVAWLGTGDKFSAYNDSLKSNFYHGP